MPSCRSAVQSLITGRQGCRLATRWRLAAAFVKVMRPPAVRPPQLHGNLTRCSSSSSRASAS